MPRPRLAISACLLGKPVRYDGGHRRQAVLRAALDPHVGWVPFCPELLAGLGVPRPPIQLEGSAEAPRAVEVAARIDRTDVLARACEELVTTLKGEGIHGLVCKSRSPSCGVGDAPLHDPDGAQGGDALAMLDGVLTAALRVAFPDLPLVTEEDLASPQACEGFLRRVQRAAR